MATTKVNVSKISDFPKVTPAGTDYILVEKDGQGGSITLSQIPVSTPVNDKITEEVNKLNSQINDLAFEPGDTTGDAELRNIRTPADGFTVPPGSNAGGAVRAQVTQLDEKISNLKGDLSEFENYVYSKNVIPTKLKAIPFPGHYTMIDNGTITTNNNYDSYLFELNSGIESITIKGTTHVCGWFSEMPRGGAVSIDQARHTDYSNSTQAILTGALYLFVDVPTGTLPPTVINARQTIVESLSQEVESLSREVAELIGGQAILSSEEWEIGDVTVSNGAIVYKTRNYNIRIRQDTTKHLTVGTRIFVEDTTNRYKLNVALKDGTVYTTKYTGYDEYEIDETGNYVIWIDDSERTVLSSVTDILNKVKMYYAGILSSNTEQLHNLFNYDTVVYGSYITESGEASENSRWYHSGSIDVISGRTYAVSCTSSQVGAYYNGDIFVDSIKRSDKTQPSNLYTLFTVPEGVNKVIVNGYREEGNGSPSITVRPEAYMMIEGDTMPNHYISNNSADNTEKIADKMLPDWIAKSNVLHGKTLLTFGDSITDGRNHDYVFNSGKGYILNYAGYTAERNGMTYHNKGWSGGTLSYGSKSMVSRGDNFNILLSDVATPDYITFMYGFNDSNNSENHELGTLDSTDKTTFCGAWNFTIPKIRELYPNARIGIIIPYGLKDGWEEMLIKIANKYGIPYWNMNDGQTHCIRGNGTTYLDTAVSTALTNKYTYDGTHPNDAGYNLISTQYEAFIRRL